MPVLAAGQRIEPPISPPTPFHGQPYLASGLSGCQTHKNAATHCNQSTFTTRASSGRKICVVRVCRNAVDVCTCLKMHHSLWLCRSCIENSSCVPKNVVRGASSFLRPTNPSNISTIGTAAFHSVMLLDGDRESMERSYWRRERIEVLCSLNCSLWKKFCDAICLYLYQDCGFKMDGDGL